MPLRVKVRKFGPNKRFRYIQDRMVRAKNNKTDIGQSYADAIDGMFGGSAGDDYMLGKSLGSNGLLRAMMRNAKKKGVSKRQVFDLMKQKVNGQILGTVGEGRKVYMRRVPNSPISSRELVNHEAYHTVPIIGQSESIAHMYGGLKSKKGKYTPGRALKAYGHLWRTRPGRAALEAAPVAAGGAMLAKDDEPKQASIMIGRAIDKVASDPKKQIFDETIKSPGIVARIGMSGEGLLETLNLAGHTGNYEAKSDTIPLPWNKDKKRVLHTVTLPGIKKKTLTASKVIDKQGASDYSPAPVKAPKVPSLPSPKKATTSGKLIKPIKPATPAAAPDVSEKEISAIQEQAAAITGTQAKVLKAKLGPVYEDYTSGFNLRVGTGTKNVNN